MKKNVIKIIYIIILFTMINTMCTRVYATEATSDGSTSESSEEATSEVDEWTGWIDQAQQFSEGEVTDGTVTFDEANVNSVSNFISGILLGISVVVAVITTAVLGITFIVQSAEEKAKVKEALVPLVVGMIISFGAYTIWKFAINILT